METQEIIIGVLIAVGSAIGAIVEWLRRKGK